MKDIFDISGRVAVITGGSKGVGRMIAEAYLERGVRVYITARHAAVVEQTAKELSELGECIGIANDVGNSDGIQELADFIKSRETKLDILVNNAGTGWHAPFDEFPEQGWDKTFNVNIKAPFFLTQQLAPLLRKAGTAEQPAKVINISSVDALYTPDDESYSYPASKAGLVHLTRKMAKDLCKDHIFVNSVAPGAFASDMNPMARDQPEELSKHIPAGRVGERDDLAGLMVFLASRASNYILGESITIDGGFIYAR